VIARQNTLILSSVGSSLHSNFMKTGGKIMSNEVTTTFHCKQNIVLESSEPIDPQDISVNIGSDNKSKTTNSQPNFLALAILWAHFEAYEQGVLKVDSPVPWEIIHTNADLSFPNQELWLQFLENIITDASWTNWIQNPLELRKRSIEAYNKIRSDDKVETDNSIEKSESFSIKQPLSIELELNIQAETENLSVTCLSNSNNQK